MFFEKLSFYDVYHKYVQESKNDYGDFINLIPKHILYCNFSKIKYLDWCFVINQNEIKNHKKLKSLISNTYNFYNNNVTHVKNYGELLEIQHLEQKNPRIPFSEYEIKQLWLNSQNKTVQQILILIYTGMRVGEFLNLKPEDINLKKRILIIKKSKTIAGTNRIIPLHKDIIPFFRNLTFDSNYSSFHCHFKEVTKQLKMDHTIHECRHTFSTIMSKTKAKHHLVKKILGHSLNDITNTYIHVQLKDLIETIDLLQGKKTIHNVYAKDDFYLR